MLWPAISPSTAKVYGHHLRMKTGEAKQRLHRPAVALESEIPIPLTLYLLVSKFLSSCLCTKCKQLGYSEALCHVDLQGIRSLLQVLVSPVLSFGSWAAIRSSKRAAASHMWKRNQTSEAQVHTVYKPSFSLSSEYMQQFLLSKTKAMDP